MGATAQMLGTAVLAAGLSTGALYLLWNRVMQPQLQRGADDVVADLQLRADRIVDDLELRAKVILDQLEERARTVGDELGAQATEQAKQELTEAAEVLIPRFRTAIRDGIQDALFSPPTDRIGRTAKDMTTAGVGLADAFVRRLMGTGTPPRRDDD